MTSAEKKKDARLRKIYKMSLKQYNHQLELQGNKCAICGRPFPKFTAFVDHFHGCCPRKLKEFCGLCNRALLCFLCNKYLVGVIERQKAGGLTTIQLVQKILDYLKYWDSILKARGIYAKEKTTAVRKA